MPNLISVLNGDGKFQMTVDVDGARSVWEGKGCYSRSFPGGVECKVSLLRLGDGRYLWREVVSLITQDLTADEVLSAVDAVERLCGFDVVPSDELLRDAESAGGSKRKVSMDRDYIRIRPSDPEDPEPKTLLNLRTSSCVGKAEHLVPPYFDRATSLTESLHQLRNGEWLILRNTIDSGTVYSRVAPREAAEWCVDNRVSVPWELERELEPDCIGLPHDDESNVEPSNAEGIVGLPNGDVGICEASWPSQSGELIEEELEQLDAMLPVGASPRSQQAEPLVTEPLSHKPRANVLTVWDADTNERFTLDTEAGPKWVGEIEVWHGNDGLSYRTVETLYRRTSGSRLTRFP